MIVGKIWDSEYPWDVRVEKVCRALSDAGHRVHLACRNRRREPEREELPYVTVHRMEPLSGFLRRWEGPLSFPAFVNPRWFRFVRSVFSDVSVDLVLCRDLPLAPLALAVGRSLDRPVVLDIAEHYPGMLSDLHDSPNARLRDLLVRNPALASWLERLVLPRVDGVIVVVDEMAERLADMGVARDRITVVSNTPALDRDVPEADGRSDGAGAEGPVSIVYFGNVDFARGLNVVLQALAVLKERGIRVRFEVYGDGKGLAVEEERAQRLDLMDRVVFHGRRPYEEILARLPEFDAGIIPHHATDQCNFTVPNKLFDSMMAGLPVLVSSMPPSKRIVESTGSGLVFRDRDPEDLARVLGQFPDEEELAQMGRAGRRAVRERFNWDRDSGRLVEALEEAARPPAASP